MGLELLLEPDVMTMIAWIVGAFILGGMLLAAILYMAEFLGWLAT